MYKQLVIGLLLCAVAFATSVSQVVTDLNDNNFWPFLDVSRKIGANNCLYYVLATLSAMYFLRLQRYLELNLIPSETGTQRRTRVRQVLRTLVWPLQETRANLE